ncbi:MAG: hypothetical protein IPM36_24770 [Lewinellaceae bacterium]|nr:hypothetical protein [Lewinellaceae bacterium]
MEYYCTIFAACESPYESGLLWTGSDDGLVHVSRDGGASWANLTPPAMGNGAWSTVWSLRSVPGKGGVCGGYVVSVGRLPALPVSHCRLRPKPGVRSSTVADPGHFTRVLRADPGKEQACFTAARSEGMYITFWTMAPTGSLSNSTCPLCPSPI